MVGWFRNQTVEENAEIASELGAIQGKMMYATSVDIEDEGEFITLVATAQTEVLTEEAEDYDESEKAVS